MGKQAKTTSEKTRAALDDALDDLERDAAEPPSPDKLDRVRAKVLELRSLEEDLQSYLYSVDETKARIRDIKERQLVDLFDEAKIEELWLGPEGNHAEFGVSVGRYVHANIPEDNAERAHAWLVKDRAGDLIKTTYVVSFGLGTQKVQRAFEALMRKAKIPYEKKSGVPWNTLTAYIKEQLTANRLDLPLELLGATVGRVASVIKPKKEKK